MTLEFDEDIARAEDAHESFEHGFGLRLDGGAAGLTVDGGERTLITSRETDETLSVGGELIVSGERVFGFAWLAVSEFGASDEAAEVLITGAVFGEESEAVWLGGVDFGSDEGSDTEFFCGEVEAWGAVDAVRVCDGHGGLVEVGAAGGEIFGKGRGFEEGEGGSGVKFDEGHEGIIWEEKANI